MVTVSATTQEHVEVGTLEARVRELESRIEALQEQLPEDRVTIVVFSGELDRVLAAFIIATGAMAMGQQVSMFFTFWGINTLKKQRILDGKSLTEKMMSLMTPATTAQMGVSNLNFFGVGAKMLRYMMKEKNVESFEGLIDLAEEMGATMYSCAMSQDVMGIKVEELRDTAEISGVAGFMADALRSKATLFI
jgi:peroxiredoxin family protein